MIRHRAHVFVSYSSKQKDIVARLMDAIEKSGVKVWYDNGQILNGEPWRSRVETEIRRSALVFFCLSEDWYQSGPCQDEAVWARYYYRPIEKIDICDIQCHLDDLVDKIKLAFEKDTERAWLSGDLEQHAFDWERAGCLRRDLARGKYLHDLRTKLPEKDVMLTDTARRYLEESIAAHRIALLTGATVIGLIICFALAQNILKLRADGTSTAAAEVNANMIWNESVELVKDETPYLALEAGLNSTELYEYGSGAAYLEYQFIQKTESIETPSNHGAKNLRVFSEFAFDGEIHNECKDDSGSFVATVHAHDFAVEIMNPFGETISRIQTSGKARDVLFSPDGMYLAILESDGVEIVDVTWGQVLLQLPGSMAFEQGELAWSPDSARIAVLGEDGDVTSWDVRKDASSIIRSKRIVSAVALSDARHAALLFTDGSMASLDMEDATPKLEELDVNISQPLAIAADSNGGAYVLSGNTDERFLHVDVKSSKVERIPVIPTDFYPQLMASAPGGGDELAFVSGDDIRVIDMKGGKEVNQLTCGPGVTALALDSNGRIYVGSNQGGCYTVEPGEQKLTVPKEARQTIAAAPRSVAVTDEGALFVGDGGLASASATFLKKDLFSWRIETAFAAGMEITSAEQAHAAAISPDGKIRAIGLSDGTIALQLDGEAGVKSVRREFAGEIYSLLFSADGKTLFAITRDGVIARIPLKEEELTLDYMKKEIAARLEQGQEFGLYTPSGIDYGDGKSNK